MASGAQKLTLYERKKEEAMGTCLLTYPGAAPPLQGGVAQQGAHVPGDPKINHHPSNLQPQPRQTCLRAAQARHIAWMYGTFWNMHCEQPTILQLCCFINNL
eukprot:GGOE01008592.1.p4 GENE.GGOE01008592.1~~GGOE01008592.1.p4  ORF type:complete len:102 (+),score=18.80 GGOE01008592.1:837-1142(+)